MDVLCMLILWSISSVFVMTTAQKSDLLLQRVSNLLRKDGVNNCLSSESIELQSQTSTDDCEDEDSSSEEIAEVHHIDPRLADVLCGRVPNTYRGLNTLPGEHVAPPSRRSLRSRKQKL
ncbi:uncharacterized protein LOC128990636 [Macrosteles quadrilineatus]|nr:uncharacterized protein LOC128990636 [Macrosteles quadrilineatus]